MAPRKARLVYTHQNTGLDVGLSEQTTQFVRPECLKRNYSMLWPERFPWRGSVTAHVRCAKVSPQSGLAGNLSDAYRSRKSVRRVGNFGFRWNCFSRSRW